MAEIQWVVEVRCVNTLLAEFKVGERGQHICVHIPDRDLDPHEFGKVIEGAEEARRIAEAHRGARQKGAVSQAAYVMQGIRSGMGDVHGSKPALNTVAFDSIKWAMIISSLLKD